MDSIFRGNLSMLA